MGVEEEEETSDERGSPGCAQSYGLVPGQITWLNGVGVSLNHCRLGHSAQHCPGPWKGGGLSQQG